MIFLLLCPRAPQNVLHAVAEGHRVAQQVTITFFAVPDDRAPCAAAIAASSAFYGAFSLAFASGRQSGRSEAQ